jgi:hypothetical protein
MFRDPVVKPVHNDNNQDMVLLFYMYSIVTVLITALMLFVPVSTYAQGVITNPGEIESAPAQTAPPPPDRMMDMDSAAGFPETSELIMPPKEDVPSIGFLGQDQKYSVTFRGNGEAVVTLRAVFSNLGTQSLDTLTFTVPKDSPEDIVAYQVIREKQCMRYRPETIAYPQNGMNQPLRGTDPSADPCLEYQEPNYFDYWYGNSRYFKAETKLDGRTITVTLPYPLAVNQSGSILLTYRGMGYATKNWTGGYDYTFETAMVTDKINSLQVGISTDAELKLKSGQAGVEYGTTAKALDQVALGSAGGGVASAQLDSFYQQIGYGSIVKTASNLQPNDTFSVDGTYGKSWVQLYASEIGIGILVVVVILVIAGVLGRLLWKRLSGPRPAATTAAGKQSHLGTTVLLSSGVGFLTAIVIALYTGLVFIIMAAISGNYYYYQLNMILSMLVMLISAGVYLFLFVTPAIVVGYKKGLWAGVATAGATVVWVGILSVVVFIISFFLFAGVSTPYTMYDTVRGAATEMKLDQPVSQPAEVVEAVQSR